MVRIKDCLDRGFTNLKKGGVVLIIRIIIILLLGFLGLLILIGNWKIFINTHIRKKEAPSWTPLLGGILICISFILIPNNLYSRWWWIAFVIDWGSIPGFMETLVWHIWRISKIRKK
jgi:tellurite resistance protein TehA-like permease